MDQVVQSEFYIDKQTGQQLSRKFIAYPFTYVVNFTALAAAGNATAQINIDAGSDFVWCKTCYMADVGGGTQTEDTRVVPLVNVSFTDTMGSRQLQSEAVPLDCVGGDGQLPFIHSQPLILSGNSNLTVGVSNFSAGTTYNVRIALIGYKKVY